LDHTPPQHEPYLLVTHATAQFNPASDHWVDVTSFRAQLETEQHEQVIALYRGELLPGFSCDSQPFDEWLRGEREALHRLALDALYALTAQHLTRADYQTAQRLAQRQLVLEPWREEAHRQLMQALALAGSRSAALAQYAICRRVLQEELGIEPASETTMLATRIRDQPLEPQAPRQSSGARLLTTPFVGRQHEYETLVNTYRQATSGTLQVVALAGHAGIGKTRLAQQFPPTHHSTVPGIANQFFMSPGNPSTNAIYASAVFASGSWVYKISIFGSEGLRCRLWAKTPCFFSSWAGTLGSGSNQEAKSFT